MRGDLQCYRYMQHVYKRLFLQEKQNKSSAHKRVEAKLKVSLSSRSGYLEDTDM